LQQLAIHSAKCH